VSGSASSRRRGAPPPRHAAKKELGQHFLVDRNLLGVIEQLAALAPDDVVLEVGPGRGILTRYLAERVAHVHAVEIDRSLEPALRGIPNTSLRFEDALSLDPASLVPSPGKLVANLPYNIATPLVLESLDALPSLSRWCVMVQREVGERFFATPGTKAYGAVSVLVQLVSERSGLHRVSREAFRPRPNVDSTLVAFTRTAPRLPDGLKRVVEGAFSHRRKTLANSLALAGVCTREQAQAALVRLGLDPAARAEELVPPAFVTLARELR
jgi:16S rRNA (adenine1518-N6/adenine1519-N6)-dimethyltransferase